ncbi:cytochrome c3 family protein [Acidicapsa acidisoli]|uniref:cytochrome c3 family protein n=1 Tax=Acidicapsa acidisoli TaxID=1615681 RepID=UPI0021DF59C6|nr:cytochrome c3 family protein [Acidicapsa acidisoli]
MAQIFDRSSNALARMSLVLTGLIVIALGVTLDSLQRSPWVTRQGQRPDQPVPFSHKHHVQGLGLQCQYCHVTVEKSSYAGIPPTKTCINCHAQIWTNAALLEPVRKSWATNESIVWTKVHDLPDYVYFNHSIHVNKGLGCSSCHGRVDLMPLMYQQNTLQMEWCLNCHRDPAKNLRPVNQVYNMAWEGPSSEKPVWCSVSEEKSGKPTAQSVNCQTSEPGKTEVASLDLNGLKLPGMRPAAAEAGDRLVMLSTAGNYTKFTSQRELGNFLIDHYKIRKPNELSSCEVCHR